MSKDFLSRPILIKGPLWSEGKKETSPFFAPNASYKMMGRFNLIWSAERR